MDEKETPSPEERPLPSALHYEQRSDPSMVFDGLQAFGVAAGGTGTLFLGVAKRKEALGEEPDAGGEPPPPSGESPPPPRASN